MRDLPRRSIATVPSSSTAPPSTPPKSTVSKESPPAISSSKPGSSQPFSTPLSPQSPNADNSQKQSAGTAAQIKGSIPGGEVLRGIGYLKAQSLIHAKEDDDYPSWLWTLLEKTHVGEDKALLSCMSDELRVHFN